NRQMIEQSADIESELRTVLRGIVWLVTGAVASKIQRDHMVVARQVWQDAGIDPVLGASANAMDQYDRRTETRFEVANPDALRIENMILREYSLRKDHGNQKRDNAP